MNTLATLLLSTVAGVADASELVSKTTSVTLEFHWPSARGPNWTEWSNWDIVFDQPEIGSIAQLLSKARLYEGGSSLMLIVSCYRGHLQTREGKYSLIIAEQKTAPTSVVFTLWAFDEPQKRFAYQLTGRDADQFLRTLSAALAQKASRQKPKRIERVVRSADWQDPIEIPPTAHGRRAESPSE